MPIFNRIHCPKCQEAHDVRGNKKKINCTKCNNPIRITPTNSNYYIEYYYERKRKRERVNCGSKILAENILQKRKIEIAEGRFLNRKKQDNVTFSKFADEYLNQHSKIYNRGWKKFDAVNIRCLKNHFGNAYLHEITTHDVEKFKSKRLAEVKPATVNRSLACLKSVYNKAILWGKIDKNPVKGVKMLKENNERKRYLTPYEQKKLLDYCDNTLKPIVIVALNTGMRKGELLWLTWQNVDISNKLIYLRNTKNGEPREIPMNNVVIDTLIKVRKHLDSDLIFANKKGLKPVNIDKSFFTALQKSGIKDFRFHDTRHSFASNLVMSGVDLNTVRELLGHKSLKMTLRYAHLSKTHKQRAVDSLDTIKTLEINTQDNATQENVANYKVSLT